MKKNSIFTIILCLILIISGCGSSQASDSSQNNSETSPSISDSSASASDNSENASMSPAPSPGSTESSAGSGDDLPENIGNPDDLTLTPKDPAEEAENGTESTEGNTGNSENGTETTDVSSVNTEGSSGGTENNTGSAENGSGSSESEEGSSESTEGSSGGTGNNSGSTENNTGSAENGSGGTENSSEGTDNSSESTENNTGSSENSSENTESTEGNSDNKEEADKQDSSQENKTDFDKEYTVKDIETFRSEKIKLTEDLQYAEFSAICTGEATLYYSDSSERGGITVCVNAGHGTKGGESVKTYCHPDKTEKVTGGTTSAGSTKAIAVSSGMTFSDGTPERKVNLAVALLVRDKLLARGYNVLMIRDTDDIQLDNVARTVLANNFANCHIAIHFDSSESNKGAYFTSVPNVKSYRAMEPVASNWEKHHALGYALLDGLKANKVKIWSDGILPVDLTQTSFSTVASVDVELGDKATKHDEASLDILAEGLADGIDVYFGY